MKSRICFQAISVNVVTEPIFFFVLLNVARDWLLRVAYLNQSGAIFIET